MLKNSSLEIFLHYKIRRIFMKQKPGRMRLILLSILSLIVCATACVFIGVNYGDKIAASAEAHAPAFKAVKTVKTSIGYVGVTEDGYRILNDKDYFTITTSGSNKTITGLSTKGYRALDCNVNTNTAIDVPFVADIPDGVTIVGANVFDMCKTLKDVYLPEGIITINRWAFRLCDMTRMELPYTLTNIATDGTAFSMLNVETISIRTGVNEDGETLYNEYYASVGTAEHPDSSIISLKYNWLQVGTAYTDLVQLANEGVRVPANNDDGYIDVKINKINHAAYCYRLNLDIKIPFGIEAFNNNPFLWAGVKTFEVEEETDYMGNVIKEHEYFKVENNCLLNKNSDPEKDGTILYLGAGETVEVPYGVTTMVGSISYYTKNVTLPNTITTVSTFGTPYVETIKMVNKDGVEEGNSKVYTENNGLYVLQGSTGKWMLQLGSANTIVSTDPNVTTISTAFENLIALKSIDIPANITGFMGASFQNSGLEHITVTENLVNINYTAVNATPYYENPENWDDGNIFYLDTILLKVTVPISGEYTVREGTLAIAENAFANDEGLKKVILPESLKSVSAAAFYGCTNLSTVYVNSELQRVGSSVFPAQTRIIVKDNEMYEALTGTDGALKNYKNRVGYAVDVTFNIAGVEETMLKLAGQPFGYNFYEHTGEWVNSGFSPAGYSVKYWRDDIDGSATNGQTVEITSATAVPAVADGVQLVYTAMKDETSNKELESANVLSKPTLTGYTIQYGEYFEDPVGYNPNNMSMKFYDEDGKLVCTAPKRPVNAGIYTVAIAPRDGFTWNEGDDLYEEITATLEITPMLITELVWSDLVFKYGRPVQVWVEFEGYDETVMILVDLPEPPAAGKPIDAGSYTLTAVLPEDSNYQLATYSNKTATLLISPQTVTVDWIGVKDFIWLTDGKEHSPQANLTAEFNVDKDLLEYTVTVYDENGDPVGADGAVEQGKYSIEIEILNGNFVFVGEFGDSIAKLDFELIDKLIVHIFWDNLDDWNYDGRDHTPDAYYTTNKSSEKVYLDVTLTLDGDSIAEAIAAGAYTASVTLPDFGEELEEDQIDGDLEVEFNIYLLQATVGWLNYYETVAYDGNKHNPVAYYTLDGRVLVKLKVKITNAAGDEVDAIEAGAYTAEIIDGLLDNMDYDTSLKAVTFTIEKQKMTITVSWTAVASYTYNGEEQSPVAMLMSLDGEEVEATAVSTYTTLSGKLLKSAPRNVGSYKVTTTFTDEDGQVLAETDYDYEIVKAQVVKPVVAISVFATVDLAKAYAPVGYDANTMVISGNEGDGVYTLTVGLKDTENYEWVDGKTEAESFTLKISPDLSATVIGPDGVTYVTNNSLDKITLYAIIGGIGLVALIAIIALIVGLRRKAIAGMSDNDGFYDDFEEEE